MLVRSVMLLAISIAATDAQLATASAQSDTVRINAAMEGDKRPFLCRERESVSLIIPIVARAQEARARGDSNKAQSLMQIAEQLQTTRNNVDQALHRGRRKLREKLADG